MIRNFRIAAGVLSVAVLCAPVLSWDGNGHLSVGAIADRLLAGTNAAKEVKKLLGTDLRAAAVWPDCAKGVNEKTSTYDNRGKFPECEVYENAADEAQMISFVKRNLKNCKSAPGAESCHRQYHYTDIAIQRNVYSKASKGTSDHDVVSAISAAIAVLQNKPAPPFQLNKAEALRVLAHALGDIHQPLHVGSVYLNAAGKIVDPDLGTFDPKTETTGGNDLVMSNSNLHRDWDNVGAVVHPGRLTAAILNEAKAVPMTVGPASGWSTIWATESLLEAKKSFTGLQYSAEDGMHHYTITLPSNYAARRKDIQRKQVIKAGARLAQLLKTIWP